MTKTPRTSRAVAAGTAAGLRHLERVYVAKVNAAVTDGREDLAFELAAELADDLALEQQRMVGALHGGDPDPLTELHRTRIA